VKMILNAVAAMFLLFGTSTSAEYSSETLYQVYVGDTDDQEIVVSTLTYEPGHSSGVHRHFAHVIVYVLEGTLRMAVGDGETVTLGPGELFVENPDDIHTVSMNASATEPAKALVFQLKDKDTPVSVPAD